MVNMERNILRIRSGKWAWERAVECVEIEDEEINKDDMVEKGSPDMSSLSTFSCISTYTAFPSPLPSIFALPFRCCQSNPWLADRLTNFPLSVLYLLSVSTVSTIFLAAGYMYPHLRVDFWFPSSFLLVRIFFVSLMLHETVFNYGPPRGGCFVYFLALLMHIFWCNKYFQGLRRRTRKAQMEFQEKKEQEQQKKEQEWQLVDSNSDGKDDGVRNTAATATETTNGTFRLRVKKAKNRLWGYLTLGGGEVEDSSMFSLSFRVLCCTYWLW